jgi:hypothetical protein
VPRRNARNAFFYGSPDPSLKKVSTAELIDRFASDPNGKHRHVWAVLSHRLKPEDRMACGIAREKSTVLLRAELGRIKRALAD